MICKINIEVKIYEVSYLDFIALKVPICPTKPQEPIPDSRAVFSILK